jgi:hypothetical protein
MSIGENTIQCILSAETKNANVRESGGVSFIHMPLLQNARREIRLCAIKCKRKNALARTAAIIRDFIARRLPAAQAESCVSKRGTSLSLPPSFKKLCTRRFRSRRRRRRRRLVVVISLFKILTDAAGAVGFILYK